MKTYFARIAIIGFVVAAISAASVWPKVAVAASVKSPAFTTTVAYVSEFYPLWFTFEQAQNFNQLIGPVRVSPLYQAVVAINVDTLYASGFISVADQPLVVTIPATSVIYSMLTLDPYGDIFETGIPSGTPGTYALTGPGWTGVLPPGVTPFPVPVNVFTLIFRADKFSPSGQDQTTQAEQFRASLKAQSLSDYKPILRAAVPKSFLRNILLSPSRLWRIT